MKREEQPRVSKKEKSEKRDLRSSFLRLFGKYDVRNEQQFIYFGKWLIFLVLVFVEILILGQYLYAFTRRGGWAMLIAIVGLETLLTVSQSLKLFAVKNGKVKMVFYILDLVAASGFLFVTDGVYPIVVYMLVLTEFYFSAERTAPSVVLLCVSAPLYTLGYGIRVSFLTGEELQLFPMISQSIGSVFALFVHFLAVQIALAFYRQFLRLDKTLKELDESKKELEKAYEVVAEVTALEERQRIAKEIHDTAGHSLTTVIMQTEAAKLILPTSPEEAKKKIVAANLQAKHALEELRDSVHLLSGIAENQTLKTALENIVHESTDGTDIKIRSEIEDIAVSPAKFRFLCNTLKEGVSNGLRHGGATAFWFELKRSGDKIEFLLSDNGRGGEESGVVPGFGLTSMSNRAKALGGEVHYRTEAGEGFELYLTLPMDTGEQHGKD